LFFFGLAATFGLVSLVPTPAGSTQWARIPAGILAVVGVLVTVSGATGGNLVAPLALMLIGGLLVLRAIRRRA
jgi:hypothetical protein